MGRVARVLVPLAAVVLFCLPDAAYAQAGNIAGTVRDASGSALAGVTVDATSPALIEKVRSTTTDTNGRYQIVNLPVGTYAVTFKLDAFGTVERNNVVISSDFSASVNAEMKLGAVKETVTVSAAAADVDVQNARQRQVFTGDEIRDLPTTRNLSSLVNLVPGIALGAANLGTAVPTICSGGAGNSDGGTGITSSTSGGLSGCSPILNAFNAHTGMADTEGLNQGRIQVDGLGVQSVFGGGRSSYLTDVGNAQEITFTLSGSLGESETGGTTINIVPRTGGNRYAGNFFTSFANGNMYGKNDDARASAFTNRLDYDYDVNGSFGGPIIKDRLWFQSVLRQQGRQNLLTDIYMNTNEGLYGASYQADRSRPVLQDEVYRQGNLRLTLQATQKNKFNFFWDEQFTCENPCEGTGSRLVSPEASATVLTYPLHLAQVSWTNPLTNRILLDAGVSWYSSHVDQTKNHYLPAYPGIPRVAETGTTSGTRGEGITSGSINNATYWNNDNVQTRASASYITGSHNVKLGYQGAYLAQVSRPSFNDMRLQYSYATPAAACIPGPTPPTGLGQTWCGLNPFNPGDPYNIYRVPVPTGVTQYIPADRDERVSFAAFYLQDQWTWQRFTLNGALRYDHSVSEYAKTCTGPDLYYTSQYCVNDPAVDPSQGVDFSDLTPRWGVAWDIFGNGKTALKWNMGKYVGGAGLSGVYVDPNVARRTLNTYGRTWVDSNGNRIPDCDLQVPVVAPAGNSFPNSGECGGNNSFDPTTNSARRFGRSPDELDELGVPIGLTSTQCGRTDSSRIAAAVQAYCGRYGDSLLSGWGKRRYEWQLGIGIQHELLPRLSMEVTYNRRTASNLTISDVVGAGCDLYSPSEDLNAPATDADGCINRLLNFQSDYYDFYALRAPVDPRFPEGGGYLIPGYADRKPTVGASTATTTAQTLSGDRRIDRWQGVDTNFTLRARGGLRLTGGTSTGFRYVNDCRAIVNTLDNLSSTASVVKRPVNEQACQPQRPAQTNVRGTASYTVPWVDVLVSTVFTYRPGAALSANYVYSLSQVEWLEGSDYRYSNTTGCVTGVAPNQVTNTGCLVSNPAGTTVTQNLLGNDTFGEGIRLFDMKFAKNIRFQRKRVNIGVDVYNVFNSDGALGYCSSYPTCGTGVNTQQWGQVTSITTPRFVRFQLQFDF